MPEIEIRPAISSDIRTLIAVDHNYSSDYVWQMELQAEETQVQVNFRQVRLPRSVCAWNIPARFHPWQKIGQNAPVYWWLYMKERLSVISV